MLAELTAAGWHRVRTTGSHSWWECSEGRHGISIADGHRKTSPALVRKIRAAIDGCQCR
jgi:predicted RNA binding protein YcfA (HicA-like mRNA interferase family)